MVDKYLNSLYLKSYSNNTLNNYKKDLLEFERYLKSFRNEEVNENLYDLNKRETRRYLLFLDDNNNSIKTVKRKLSSVRGFYKFLKKEKIVENEFFSSLESPKLPRRLPRILSESDMNRIFENVDKKTDLGFRNYLILEILYSCGFRVSELTNLKIKDLNFANDYIKVLGKGNKERIMPMHTLLKKNLVKYIKNNRKNILIKNEIKVDHEYLFINYKGFKLSDRSVRNILNSLIKNVEGVYSIHPHMIRHSFATVMLESGSDLRVLQEMLGHESLISTQVYTHVSDKKIKDEFGIKHPRGEINDYK